MNPPKRHSIPTCFRSLLLPLARLLWCLLLLAKPIPVDAAPNTPGQLNRSFAGFGVQGVCNAVTSMGLESFDITAVGQLPDGTLVATGGGRFPGATQTSFIVVRTSNLRGARTIVRALPLPAVSNAFPNGMKVTPDGRIVVAGYYEGVDGYHAVVARLLPDSQLSLDDSFGGGGMLYVNVQRLTDVLVQSDQKIIVATDYGQTLRFNENGSNDATYQDPYAPGYFLRYSTSLAFDGSKIVVAGADDAFNTDLGLIRLNSSGAFDNTFSSDGRNRYGAGSLNDLILDVTVDSHHRPLMLGRDWSAEGGLAFCSGLNEKFPVSCGNGRHLFRLTEEGDLDPSYGDSPGQIIIGNTGDFGLTLTTQPDDKAIVGGLNAGGGLWVTRRKFNGGPDTTFGPDGHVRIPSLGKVKDVITQPNGNIVLAAQDGIVRLRPDGSLDDGGYATYQFGNNFLNEPYGAFETANAITLQANGMLLVAGTTTSAYEKAQIVLTRLFPNGERDFTFNNGIGYNIVGLASAWEYAAAILVQPNGKILVAGQVDRDNGNHSLGIYRFNNDGTTDLTLGGVGHVYKSFLGGAQPQSAHAMGMAPDGKIVLLGQVGDSNLIGIWRLNADCSDDANFRPILSTPGIGLFSFQTGPSFATPAALSYPRGLAIQSDKKIVIGGSAVASLGTNGHVSLLRLNENGTVDTSFGQNGYGGFATNSDNQVVSSMALLPDGGLILAGSSDDQMMVASFQGYGAVNPNFGSGSGKVSFSFAPGTTSFVNALNIRSDKLISVAGTVQHPHTGTIANYKTQAFWAAAALNALDGSFVTTFGSTGKAEYGFPIYDEQVNFPSHAGVTAITVRDDEVYVAGYIAHLNSPQFAVMNIQTTSPNAVRFVSAASVWRQANFNTTSNTSIAANLADPDGDGLVNLVEYAFGLDPQNPTSIQIPPWQRNGNTLTNSFNGQPDVTYIAEKSTTLAAGSWTPITDTGNGNAHIFSVPIDPVGVPKVFFRFRLNQAAEPALPQLTLSEVITNPSPQTSPLTDGQNFTFGTTPIGTSLTRHLRLTNVGGGPLVFDNIITPPGFENPGSVLALLMTEGSLAPGASVDFDLSLAASNPLGNVIGEFSINSNDPVSPHYVLQLSGNMANPDRGLANAVGVAVDPNSGKVFVVDGVNHRVLRYPASVSTDTAAIITTPAEAVFGQIDTYENSPGSGNAKFTSPKAAAVDGSGNLYVLDSGNNRIVRFSAAATAATGAVGDWVLGQPGFLSTNAGNGSAQFNNPQGFTISGGYLVVADTGNHRAQVFVDLANLASGASVFQSYGTGVAGTSATALSSPTSVAVSYTGNVALQKSHLWVADTGNHRVVRFNEINGVPIVDGIIYDKTADSVLGQVNFTSNTFPNSPTATNCDPISVLVQGTRLYVTDHQFSRVLRYDSAFTKTNGAAADGVLGKVSFTVASNTGAGTYGHMALAGSALWVANQLTVERFNAPTTFSAQLADSVLRAP